MTNSRQNSILMSSASEPEVPLPSLGNEESYATVVAFARREAIDSHTVARLALHLAESGERLVWSDGSKVADVASTGGPGSLSTLLCPLITRVLGYQVVKLAVPGRPAGAIDSFGTLPGYKTTLSSTEVRRVVEACGFAHFLADARFAPLDAELFQYRRRTGAVAVPMLAASSLLSKKLAVGVNTVGLDVRVGLHGNFGRTIEAARVNARLFCEAAALLGIRATAFLTGGTGPVQPFIGRGEALLALAYACGVAEVEGNEWLSEHVRDCLALTERTVAPSMVSGADSSTHKVSSADVLSVLTTHLRAQGSSIDAFESRVHAISKNEAYDKIGHLDKG